MTPDNRKRLYCGMIIPSDWDEKGRPISVCLATERELIELIPHKINNRQLLNLIHQQVEIYGETCLNLKRKSVRVDRFKTKPDGPQ